MCDLMQRSGYVNASTYSIVAGAIHRCVPPERGAKRRSSDAVSRKMLACLEGAMSEMDAGLPTVKIHTVSGYACDHRR
jgi:hypothetical protein